MIFTTQQDMIGDFMKWQDVVKTKNFQEDSPHGKTIQKTQFYYQVISKSDKFKELSSKQKVKVRKNFFKTNLKGEPTIKEYIKSGFKKPMANAFLVNVMNWGGDIVEAGAKFIEPDIKKEVTAETSNLAIAGLAARQGMADFLRFYKPWNVMAAQGTGMALKKVAPPIGRGIAKITPKAIKDPLARFFTVGKGQPAAYQLLKERNILGKAAGGREAEAVAKTLSVAPRNIKIPLKGGGFKIIKKGQPIPLQHQRYVGRIFRKEIDISGRKSRLTESLEKSKRISKNVEVEVGFSKKVQGLKGKLNAVKKALGDKKAIAESKIGTIIETKPGNIEKIVGVKQATRTLKSGKIKKLNKYDLIAEPVKPTRSMKARVIPQTMAEEAKVLRSVKGFGKEKALVKVKSLSREQLLSKKKALSKELQKEVLKIETDVRARYDIFDKTFVDRIKNHPKYKVLKEVSDEGRSVMDKWSKELVKSGVPKEEAKLVIENNVGNYMARMYTSKLAKKGSMFSINNIRLRLQGLKHRKDLTETVRKQLGEIKEPAYPTAVRVKQISETIQNNKLFNAVAKNKEWVANKNVTGNMIKMSDSPALGALRNKWVIPEIGRDINGLMKVREASLEITAKVGGLYKKALGKWKYGKVVLNPATHARNMISNSMLLDLSGVSHLQQARLYPRIVKEYLKKGKLYQLAQKHGAIGGEFVGGDVAKLAEFYKAGRGGNLSKLMNTLKTPFRKAGDLYQAEEQISKMIKFAHSIEKGATPEMAAKQAQKWLFNYTDIPDVIRLAKQAAPFITFTYKAIPRVGEAMVTNPMRVYKYYALFNSWNSAARKLQGMTPEEYAKKEELLPPWLMNSIGGMPTTLLLPWKDKYDRTQWLNLEYILPIGMAPEIMQKGFIKGGITNPVFNILASLKKNKDFKGQKIIPAESTNLEAAQAATEHVYRQLAPSLAPSLGFIKGGYSFEKIMDAIQGRPDYAGRVRDLSPVLFDTLAGLKLTPLDTQEAEYFKMKEKQDILEELNGQAFKLMHPAVSEEAKEKGLERIYKKMQRVMDR